MAVKGATRKRVKKAVVTNWMSTLAGMITGGALAYAGYKSGNMEMMIAGASAATAGLVAQDSQGD